MLETRASVLYGDLLACDHFEPPELAGKLAVPALIVFGDQDMMVPSQGGRLLQEKIPGARLELVRGAGHMVMLEQPDRMAGLLSEFLNTVPYQPGKYGNP
jgi:pimeloyl-ACP methyl ester carboxylesterase